MDKIITDKWMYIPNDYTQNTPFRRFKLVVETLNVMNQQIKIHISPPKF